MMHRFPLATDADIENLIMQVYEAMPVPDQSRLSLIEGKLLQKAKKNKSKNKLNKIPWWLVLVLAGGFASAAWWACDFFIGKQNKEIESQHTVSSDKIIEPQDMVNDDDSSAENKKQNNEIYEDRDSPVIYQRESF